MRDQIVTKVIEIVQNCCGLSEDEKVSEDTNLYNDLGADSLDVAEIAVMVEREYEIVIPNSAELQMVKDIVDRVCEYKNIPANN